MSASWFIYALAAGSLVGGGAMALAELCRALRLPTRFTWAAALVATLVLLAITAGGDADAGAAVGGEVGALSPATPSDASFSLGTALASGMAIGLAAIQAALVWAARQLPSGIAGSLGVLWMLTTSAVLLTLALVSARLRRVRREWPEADLLGHRVRIAPALGPAVVGLLRPEIVLPRWMLARATADQRLVLAHEHEHLRAYDHMLLGGACVAVALVPWHPAAWWMLSRLRLAIELDCDERVLRRGVARDSYGALLIDLAGRCSGFRVGAPALADKKSHLERRLLAMTTARPRLSLLRVAGLLSFAAVALLTACEAKVPTAAEIDAMDVAGAERAALGAQFMKHDATNTAFFIDDVKVTAAEAHALKPERIATVSVSKGEAGEAASVIRIVTTGIRDRSPEEASALYQLHVRVHNALSGNSAPAKPLAGSDNKRVALGLIYVDGVQVDEAALSRLRPQDIVTVNILKGPAAVSASSDPAAVNGIVRITTKK